MSHPESHQQTVTVQLRDGLHLRPQSLIVRLAQQFPCDVRIQKGAQSVDAKSMLDLMTLRAEYHTELCIRATGQDAARAVDALVRLFESDFEQEIETTG